MPDISLPANGWRPRQYQLPFWNYMERNHTKGARAVIAWHRRAGKDLTCINFTAWASMQRIGLYWLVFPLLNQGRRIAWTGMDGGGIPFINAWPKELIASKQGGEMRLTLKNGSILQVMGADKPDRAVGANPIGMVFSEYSLCDPSIWKLTAPILAENGGWAVFNGTPRGENHFYDILQEAKMNEKWFASHLTSKDTKAVTPAALREAKKELNDEALFQQEFMTSFSSPLQGSYYDTAMKNLAKKKRMLEEITPDPKLEVHTAWDLGVSDSTSIWFYQQYDAEIRILDYYESSGEGLPYYIRMLKEWAVDNNIVYGKHFAPHDIKVKELSSGKSRIETARKLGIKFTVVQKHDLLDGIEQVRNFLPRCWFDRNRCYDGINALKSYRKEFDALRNTFKPKPLHDWSSHAADAFRYLAWGFRDAKKKEARSRVGHQYSINYDIFD